MFRVVFTSYEIEEITLMTLLVVLFYMNDTAVLLNWFS